MGPIPSRIACRQRYRFGRRMLPCRAVRSDPDDRPRRPPAGRRADPRVAPAALHAGQAGRAARRGRASRPRPGRGARRHRFTPAAVADPFTLTSPLQFLTAARNAIGGYDGTDLGVRVGHRLHVSSYGMYGYAMLCSESLAHAFESAVKYHRLANGMLAIRWSNTATSCRGSFPTGTKSRYRISTSRCTVS